MKEWCGIVVPMSMLKFPLWKEVTLRFISILNSFAITAGHTTFVSVSYLFNLSPGRDVNEVWRTVFTECSTSMLE
jgi:hypothetical protein